MCKILCLTSHDPAQRNAIITRVWNEMTGQTDGYGAAWFGADGEIGYFKRSHPRIYGYGEEGPYVAPDYVTRKKPVGYQKPQFHESNDIPSDGGFLIIHGRNATNAVKVENTHPMLMPGAALVHNGVVQSSKYVNELPGCTCDTELLLNAYVSGGIPEIEDEITGYYAFMCLQIDEDNAKTLHVVKDSRASLHCGITQDQTRVFGTVESLLRCVGADPHGEMEDNTAIIFTSKTEHTTGSFSPSLMTPTSKEFRDRTNKAFGTQNQHGPSEDDAYADYWQGRGAASSTYPQQNKPPLVSADSAEALKRDMDAIERMEKQAIDDKVFEVAAKS